MKKYFIRVSRIFMTIAFIFLVVIINTDARVENQEKYNIMQKANHNIEKNLEETKQKETTSAKENTDKNEQIKATSSKKEEVKEVTKEEKEVKKEEKVKNTTVVQTSSTDNSAQSNITKGNTDSTKYGTYGRLYVSSYDVALYDYNVNTTSSYALQTLVDNKDSAAYYKSRGKLVIADHYNQGFSVLTKLTEGSTAYIKLEDGTIIRYRLIKISEGTNTGPDLVDKEGNSFYSMDSDLIMYTCYDDGIMATLWVLA